jgi:hypothetical protein
MKLILWLLILVPLSLPAQPKKSKGFASFALGIDVPVPTTQPAFGGHFSANAGVGPGNYLGLGLGFVKFQGIDKLYIPISLNLTAVFKPQSKKASMMFSLQPGYGVFNSPGRGLIPNTTGGLMAYAGLGIALPKIKNTGAFITVGYSLYTFTTGNSKSTTEGIGLRAGLMF